MHIRDLNDKDAVISFYFTPGDGFLWLGNNVLHKSDQMGKDNVLRIPKGPDDLILPTYTKNGSDGSLRTYLFVVPTKTRFIKSYVVTLSSLFSKKSTNLPDTSNGKVAETTRAETLRLFSLEHG